MNIKMKAVNLLKKVVKTMQEVNRNRIKNNHFEYRRIFEYSLKQHNIQARSLMAVMAGLVTGYFVIFVYSLSFFMSAGLMIIFGMEFMKISWGIGKIKPYYRKSYVDIFQIMKQYLYLSRFSMGLIAGGLIKYYFTFPTISLLNPLAYFSAPGLIFGSIMASIYIYEIGFKDRFVTPAKYEELMNGFEEIHKRVLSPIGIDPQSEYERLNDVVFFIENYKGDELERFERACGVVAYEKNTGFVHGIDSAIYNPKDIDIDEDYREESEDEEIRRG